MTIYYTNDKSSINSDSKEKKPVEIHKGSNKKITPENKSKKWFISTWISKGRVFSKKFIKISIKKVKNKTIDIKSLIMIL